MFPFVSYCEIVGLSFLFPLNYLKNISTLMCQVYSALDHSLVAQADYYQLYYTNYFWMFRQTAFNMFYQLYYQCHYGLFCMQFS